MRVTNEMYPRGSVVIPSFPKDSDRAYLHGRPMIVISNISLFNSVTCVECTSRDRPGIEVEIFNHYTGTYLSGAGASIACPYAIHDVPVKCIKDYYGVVTPITLQAITDAMAWHLGITQIPPKYMEQIIEEQYAPIYNMGTSANTSLNVARGVCSSIEQHRTFGTVPFSSDKGIPYKSSQTVNPIVISTPVEIPAVPKSNFERVSDWAKIAIEVDSSAFVSTEALFVAYNEANPSAQLSKIGFGKHFVKYMNESGIAYKREHRFHDTGKRKTSIQVYCGIGLSTMSIEKAPSDPAGNEIIAQRLAVFKQMTVAERAGILLKQIQPGSSYEARTLDAEDITWLTRRILDNLGYCNDSFTADLVKGIENQGYHWNFIDADKVIALMLYGDWDRIKPSAFIKIEARFKYLIQSQHLDFSDLRKWPKIHNGKELKKLISGGGAKSTIPLQAYNTVLAATL